MSGALAGHSTSCSGLQGGFRARAALGMVTGACTGVCCGWHAWSFAVFPVACPDSSLKVDVGLQHCRIASGGHAGHAFPGTLLIDLSAQSAHEEVVQHQTLETLLQMCGDCLQKGGVHSAAGGVLAARCLTLLAGLLVVPSRHQRGSQFYASSQAGGAVGAAMLSCFNRLHWWR